MLAKLPLALSILADSAARCSFGPGLDPVWRDVAALKWARSDGDFAAALARRPVVTVLAACARQHGYTNNYPCTDDARILAWVGYLNGSAIGDESWAISERAGYVKVTRSAIHRSIEEGYEIEVDERSRAVAFRVAWTLWVLNRAGATPCTRAFT